MLLQHLLHFTILVVPLFIQWFEKVRENQLKLTYLLQYQCSLAIRDIGQKIIAGKWLLNNK